MQQQQPQQNDKEFQGSFNVVFAFLNAFANCFTPFLRTDFGKEALGMSGLMALIIVIAYGSFANSAGMWIFLWLYILALLKQRIRGIQNRKRGVVIHSRYTGYPWLSFKLFPWIKDETDARGADGFLCMGMGALLIWSEAEPALGCFFALGGVSLLFVEGFMVELRKKRLQSMRDAEIEQRDLADHYRNGRF